MRIIGTGSMLPERSISNDELTGFLDTSHEWISTRTGIVARRVITNETLTQLGAGAATRALEDADIRASDIDLILCTTVMGDTMTPGLSCLIQGAIGAACPTMDINCACAGFVYALDTADAYLRAGKARRILIVSAESNTRLCDWTDRRSAILFGDGAAAVVVDAGEGLICTRLTTSSNVAVLYARPNPGNSPYRVGEGYAPLTMDGQEVYKFAVSVSAEDIRYVLEASGLVPDQIKYYLIHQANLRIVNSVRARLKLDAERFPTNIERYGNTSSASIPLLLDELNRSGALSDGDLLVMSAFGAGLTTSACALRWAK